MHSWDEQQNRVYGLHPWNILPNLCQGQSCSVSMRPYDLIQEWVGVCSKNQQDTLRLIRISQCHKAETGCKVIVRWHSKKTATSVYQHFGFLFYDLKNSGKQKSVMWFTTFILDKIQSILSPKCELICHRNLFLKDELLICLSSNSFSYISQYCSLSFSALVTSDFY